MHRVAVRSLGLPLIILMLAGGVSAGNSGDAEGFRCETTGVVAVGWSAAEKDLICAAADAAIGFLRDAGLQHQRGVTIQPLQDVPEEFRGCELGHYDIECGEVSMMPLAASTQALGRQSALGVPMSPALWASYVSHEVAHAVIEPHFADGVRRFTASEYIAAVVQLATMPPALRESILARFAGLQPYHAPDEISSLYYLMAPGEFAVKVYLHYTALGDGGPQFISWLLHHGLSK